jgi:hypothetical protein
MLVTPDTDFAKNPQAFADLQRQLAAQHAAPQHQQHPGSYQVPQQDSGPFPGWVAAGPQPAPPVNAVAPIDPSVPATANWNCINCGTVQSTRRPSASSPTGVEWPCPKCKRIISRAAFTPEGEPGPLPEGFSGVELTAPPVREFSFWRQATPGGLPALGCDFDNNGRSQPMSVPYSHTLYKSILALLEDAERLKIQVSSGSDEALTKALSQSATQAAESERQLAEALRKIEGLQIEVARLTSAEKALIAERDALAAKAVNAESEAKAAFKEVDKLRGKK